MAEDNNRIRLDKWLWAARFYKTRSIAADAVEGGKVLVNGARVKPARALKVGDELAIRTLSAMFTVHVRGLSARRGSAKDAAGLYTETEGSKFNREQLGLYRLPSHPGAQARGRPTKRSRRLIHKFRGEPL